MSAAFDQTGLTDLRIDPAFAGVDGSGVGVAVLDSGIYALHPTLRPNVVAYYNAVGNPIPATVDASSIQFARDLQGHGTHVAGTVAASDPAIGVAPAAKIVAIKVLSDPAEPQIGGNAVLRGLQFVRQFADQFNIKVVNMSLGFFGQTGGLNLNEVPDPDDLSRAIDDLEAMGITVVSASGNSYANDPVPGAGFPAVASTISVASTWSTTGVGHSFGGVGLGTPFDQYGPFEQSALPDRFAASSQRSTLPNQLAAPGVDIFSTWNGEPGIGGPRIFNTISGTSMASPFVSGLVALMQDAAMTFGGRYIEDVDDIFDILEETADTITDSNVSDNGRYRIVNGFLDPTPLPLPETGEEFQRVNALNAVRRVRSILTGGGPGGDTDSTTGNSTALPPLTGSTSIVRRGRIGADGEIVIGPNDVDLFRVNLQTPGDITVLLTPPAGGTAFAPSVRLFNAAGAEVGRADALNGIYPTLRTSPDAPLPVGVYYVGVSSMANFAYNIGNGSGATGGTSEGDYALTISLNNPDEDGVVQGAHRVDLTLPDTLAFASVIAAQRNGVIGADEPGAISGGDVDMYEVVAPDDGTIQARTLSNSLPGGAFVDTYVRVFDSNLVEIGANDNITPVNPDSLVDVPVEMGKTYYIGVTNFANRTFSPLDPYGRIPGSTPEIEPYNLYLSFASGDVDGTVVTAAAGAVGQARADAVGTDDGDVVGASNGFKDVDFVRFTVPESGLLDLSAVAGTAGLETVLALWEFNPTQSTVVKLGDAGGATAQLIRQVPAGHVIYASVTGRGNQDFNWFARASGPGGQTGSYTLNSAMRPLKDLETLSDGSIVNNLPKQITAAAAAVGSVGFDGSLLLDADVDLYRFVPTATGRYDIRTNTSAEGSADTVLRLFREDGTPVALNDDATAATTGSALRVSLSEGEVYFIGVSGAPSGEAPVAAYDARTGADAPAGSRGAYTLSVSPTAANAPAVSVADAAPVAEAFRGGATATFTVTLDAPATSVVTVGYVVTGGTATAGTDFTAGTGTLTFQPGETSKTFTVAVLGDAQIEGDETLSVDLAVVEGAEAVVADAHAEGTIQNQVVVPIAFNAGVPANFTDANGSRVRVTLRGPGSGEVLLLDGAAADPAAITLSGTTGASALTVTGDTSVGDITVNGALRSITGRTLDLNGNVNVSGSLAQLRVRNASGGHAVNVGAGAPLNAAFASVTNLSLTSAAPITSLRVGQWSDDGATDVVTAPSITSITAAGDFGADVIVSGNLGRLTVGRTLVGSDVRVGGRITAVRLGGSTGSRIFAGVKGEITTLPDGTDDFASPTSAIGSLTVTGRSSPFADTLVAAPSIGRVMLGAVSAANGDEAHGLAADGILSLTTPSLRLRNLSAPGDSRTDDDFVVRIL